MKAKKTLWQILPWKPLVLAAAGIILYLLLGWYVRPPLPFGLQLRLQYAVLAFFAVVYGPVMGLVVGLGGEIALALAGSGIWWSVVAASALAGFFTGFLAHGKFRRQGGFTGGVMARFIVACLLAHAVAWVVVCSALDMLFYREALDNILQRGVSATISNGGCALLGGGLLLALLGNIAPWQYGYSQPAQQAYQPPPEDLFDATDDYGM